MSSTKPRNRRNRQKKFIQRDEQNEIGVMEQSTMQYKNKIEEKQEDMFDPHKLKQNILQQDLGQKSFQANFIDFGDQQEPTETVTSKIQVPTTNFKEEEQSPKKGSTRKRVKRQKKQMINSDEDIQQQKQQHYSSIKKVQQDITTPTKEQAKRQINSVKQRESNSSNQQDEDQNDDRLQKLAEQKRNNQKKANLGENNNLILMHTIMSKAGVNKEERRRAIYTPLKQEQHSFIYFKRVQSGFSQYYQAIGEDLRPILFCQNQRGCIGCNYYISLTKQMDKNNPSYLGKLRGNAAGSIYQLYDNGLQPNSDYDRSKFRVSMAYVEYESNFLGMKGPRKLKAIVPNLKYNQDYDTYKLSQEETLDNFQPPVVINLRNKQPRWNERLKSYALNFGGRVKQASIKNFILMDDSYNTNEEDKAPNVIIFGKVDENSFALQFRHPLSLYQAFGIAVSEFDFKLKCQ